MSDPNVNPATEPEPADAGDDDSTTVNVPATVPVEVPDGDVDPGDQPDDA
jgi:hypothetical protein